MSSWSELALTHNLPQQAHGNARLQLSTARFRGDTDQQALSSTTPAASQHLIQSTHDAVLALVLSHHDSAPPDAAHTLAGVVGQGSGVGHCGAQDLVQRVAGVDLAGNLVEVPVLVAGVHVGVVVVVVAVVLFPGRWVGRLCNWVKCTVGRMRGS